MLPGVELENDPDDNPCFGCGPNNPIGLRMRFFDDGATVRSRLVLDDRYCGSYGRVLEPLVYAAMDETIVWAAWARLGELPASATDAPTLLRYYGRVFTGEPFVVACAVAREDTGTMLMRAVVTQGDAVRAEMEWPMRRRTDAEIAAALARPKLSRSIRAELEEMAKRRAVAAERGGGPVSTSEPS
jgi:hypothetical protein